MSLSYTTRATLDDTLSESITTGYLDNPLLTLTSPDDQTINNSDLSFTEWTFYLKFDHQSSPADTEHVFLFVNDSSNYVECRYIVTGGPNYSLRLDINSDSNLVANSINDYPEAYVTTPAITTLIVAAREDDVVIAVNGEIQLTIDSVAMPLGTPNSLSIGRNNVGTSVMESDLIESRFWLKRLSNTDIGHIGRV